MPTQNTIVSPMWGPLSRVLPFPSGRLVTHSPSRGSWTWPASTAVQEAGPPVARAGLIQSSPLRGPASCSLWTSFQVAPALLPSFSKPLRLSEHYSCPFSRFRGGPRTPGAGPHHTWAGRPAPVWALTAPRRSLPFIHPAAALLFPASVFLLWGPF